MAAAIDRRTARGFILSAHGEPIDHDGITSFAEALDDCRHQGMIAEPRADGLELPVSGEGTSLKEPHTRRERSIQHAGLSVLIPGLGQVAQRRFVAAAVQFATVSAYVVAAVGLGGHRAAFLAAAWNVWSAIDAYRHDAD